MISEFGKILREIRKKENETLIIMSEKLKVSAPFLSMMEVGRKNVPPIYAEKIRELYNLSENDYNILKDAIIETNQHVDIEISKMNEAQKHVSMIFARKIIDADPELVEKLRKVLEENDKN